MTWRVCKRYTPLLIASALAVTGCELFTGPSNIYVGIIEWGSASTTSAGPTPDAIGADPLIIDSGVPVLIAPDTVEAGTAFEIVVNTWGVDTCWEEAGGKTSTSGGLFEVTPYDRNTREDQHPPSCGHSVTRLPRSFTTAFSERGEAIIRVNGRRLISDGGEQDDHFVSMQEVVVVR